MTPGTFVTEVLQNPASATILERLATAGLSDAWLVSGALFQTVWNIRTGREPTYGIRDYDVFYFDPDTSWAAEDIVIKRTAGLFADLGATIEVRNQARVHLWYQEKFGTPYPPASRATDGIDRFLMPCAQVGIRTNGSGHDVYAPRGFSDIEQLIVRPNRTPNFRADRYEEKATRWKTLWPELTILPAENGGSQ